MCDLVRLQFKRTYQCLHQILESIVRMNEQKDLLVLGGLFILLALLLLEC